MDIKTKLTKTRARSAALRAATALALLSPAMAFAGSTDTTFDSVYTQAVNWTQGSLGRLITLVFILVGLIGGIARQSLIAFAVGVGGGIGLYNAPSIVASLFSANIL